MKSALIFVLAPCLALAFATVGVYGHLQMFATQKAMWGILYGPIWWTGATVMATVTAGGILAALPYLASSARSGWIPRLLLSATFSVTALVGLPLLNPELSTHSTVLAHGGTNLWLVGMSSLQTVALVAAAGGVPVMMAVTLIIHAWRGASWRRWVDVVMAFGLAIVFTFTTITAAGAQQLIYDQMVSAGEMGVPIMLFISPAMLALHAIFPWLIAGVTAYAATTNRPE